MSFTKIREKIFILNIYRNVTDPSSVRMIIKLAETCTNAEEMETDQNCSEISD